MAISKLNPIEGGIPKGNTAARPANPVVGTVYYNGEIEALEIYNGTSWKVSKTEGFPPDAPTISSVTDSSTSAAYSSTAGTLTIVMVPAATGGTATQYNAYTTVGGHSGFTTVGTTVTITGLTPGTAYTVYGNAQNGSGTSTNTNNASPVTPTTLPQVPTIGTATASTSANEVTVTWTNGVTGGKNLSSITITPFLNGTTAETSRTAATTSSTSYTFTDGQLTAGAAYTFKVKTTNANGTCADSTATNSVTAPNLILIDYLVVAGGGGGSGYVGEGGGGAGGLRSTVTATGRGGALETPLTLSKSTNYVVTVGAGGNGGPSGGGSGGASNGTNSIFSSITSIGGGEGRFNGSTVDNVGNGGSGGGGSFGGGATKPGGTGTTGQGYDGGAGSDDAGGNARGGGGGGAGSAGGNAVNSGGAVGNGGNGVAVAITGSSVTYAGGGGGGHNGGTGGSGGTGGGGSNGAAGTVNTGGGGGASSQQSTGGSGGSGVVILRYLTSAGTITIGSGLTGSTATSGSYKVTTITAGTGNVSWT